MTRRSRRSTNTTKPARIGTAARSVKHAAGEKEEDMSSRRKTDKTKKEPLYQVTPKQIEQYKQMGREEGRQDAIRNSIVFLFWLTFIALRDEFGFGKTRMLRVMRKLGELVGDMNEGRFELVDCRTELKREIGVDIGDRSIFIPDEGKA